LYGAQSFTLARLMAAIERAKSRGVRVALSIDGSKRTRSHTIELDIPTGLFGTTAEVVVGRSMLRRFQLQGQTLESEVVHDRLLLTWRED
jgi:DNA adenine methylase